MIPFQIIRGVSVFLLCSFGVLHAKMDQVSAPVKTRMDIGSFGYLENSDIIHQVEDLIKHSSN